jgi:hypothetical protein
MVEDVLDQGNDDTVAGPCNREAAVVRHHFRYRAGRYTVEGLHDPVHVPQCFSGTPVVGFRDGLHSRRDRHHRLLFDCRQVRAIFAAVVAPDLVQ